MISIIVSSYNDQYYKSFEKSVSQSIGDTKYEIIRIENHGLMSLAQAYNQGARQANYANLLFVHEDTIFRSTDWGQELINLISDTDIGVVGIAGEDYASYVPSYWFSSNLKKMHFIQKYPDKEEIILDRVNFKIDSKNENVKSLDGVFLACSAKVFSEFKFDESIRGYHGYDMDFSLRVSQKYQNIVTSLVTLEHRSTGQLSKEWLSSLIFVWQKNKKIKFAKYDKSIELEKFYALILMMKKFDFKKSEIIGTTIQYLNPFKIGYINSIKVILRLRYLK